MSDWTLSSGPPSPEDISRSESGMGEEIEMDTLSGDIQDIIDRLEDVSNIRPDGEFSRYESASGGSVSTRSSFDSCLVKDITDEPDNTIYEDFTKYSSPSKPPRRHSTTSSSHFDNEMFMYDERQSSRTRLVSRCVSNPTKEEDSSLFKNPLKFLRRLSSKDSFELSKDADHEYARQVQQQSAPRTLSDVRRTKQEQWLMLRVVRLPQIFITKYLGSKPCTGLCGVGHIRAPVEELVEEARILGPDADLPLAELLISQEGIEVSEHELNKAAKIEKVSIPIEFISYGVQDSKYSRVFAFILVQQMSWNAQKLACHAYLCDRPATARRLALAVALAFKEYGKTLQGEAYKFKIDLTIDKPGDVPVKKEPPRKTKAKAGPSSEFDA